MARITNRKRAFRETIADTASRLENRYLAEIYQFAVEQALEHGDDSYMRFMAQLEQVPVSIEEFLDSDQFMGATDLSLWPEVRKSIIELNRDWFKGKSFGSYEEAVLMGATGVAKSTIAVVSSLYRVHILHCMSSPQVWYGLPSATPIVFAILAAKPRVMKNVLYGPMRTWVETMPWFRRYARTDKLVEAQMVFPDKNITIVPAGTSEDSILGEAVINFIVDEINFMQVVQKSKKAEVSTGRSGLYDQAEVTYETALRRKTSRFSAMGPSIGLAIASSSTRYKGDFTDRRKALVDKGLIKNCYVYNRKQYDVCPAVDAKSGKVRYCGKKFRLLIGNDAQHDTRVLSDTEIVPVGSWVENVPIEYLQQFQTKPFDALRDIIGISHNAVSPFIKSRVKVFASVEMWKAQGILPILNKSHVILGVDGMPSVREGVYCTNPSKARFVHIDLSRNRDRCGIGMVRVDGVTSVMRSSGEVENLPVCTVEMACTIEPDANNEIDIGEIRAFVRQLKTQYGYPIRGVSYDGMDSRESIQAWKKTGVMASMLSLDRYDTNYLQFRDGIYDGRILLPDDDLIIEELNNLEHDITHRKVDHPSNFTKDGIDGVAGAYCNALSFRSTWSFRAGNEVDLDMMGRDDGDRDDGSRPV